MNRRECLGHEPSSAAIRNPRRRGLRVTLDEWRGRRKDCTLARHDVFSFSSAEWIWKEDTGQVILTGQRILRVTVDPANYTPGLISSDASCPVGNGNGIVIGFDIVFDIHTGAITGIRPGLGCITC
jgi:hypothetical protein